MKTVQSEALVDYINKEIAAGNAFLEKNKFQFCLCDNCIEKNLELRAVDARVETLKKILEKLMEF